MGQGAFPARAGMIRNTAFDVVLRDGVPRPRGDDPMVRVLERVMSVRSPPARG